MKKIKLILSAIICFSLLLCLFSCANAPGTPDDSGNDITTADGTLDGNGLLISELTALVSDSYLPEDYSNNNSILACWGEDVEDIDDMFEDASDVVIARVLDTVALYERFHSGNVRDEYTIRDIEIQYSVKGYYEAGDIVPVTQTGYTREDGSDLSIAGVPLLKSGQYVLLFLDGGLDYSDDEEWAKSYACILDEYGGKFYIDSDGSIVPSANFAPSYCKTYLLPGSEDLTNFTSVINLAERHGYPAQESQID